MKHRHTQALAIAVLGSALATGCGGAVDARMVATAPPQIVSRGAVESYILTPREVQLEAGVTAGASHTLAFQKTTGTMDLSPVVPEASSFALLVDTRSATASWAAVGDLAKDRFLHVHEFPEARFVSRSVRRAEEGAEQGYVLYGDFTLHGTTRTIAVPAAFTIDSCRARFECAFTIQRSVFGVVDKGNLEGLVSDDVEIRVSIDVPRASAPATCRAPAAGGTG